MSFCNYYYRTDTGKEIQEHGYKVNLNYAGFVDCAIKKDYDSGIITEYTINKDDDLFKNYYGYYCVDQTYYVSRDNTTDKEVLRIMDKYNIDELIIDVF